MSLLTDLSSALVFKQLAKCKVKQSVRLNGKMFSFGEKYNYTKNPIQNQTAIVRLYINLESHTDLTKEQFEKHFTEL